MDMETALAEAYEAADRAHVQAALGSAEERAWLAMVELIDALISLHDHGGLQ